MSAWIEIYFAKRFINIVHEIWRGEAGITIFLLTQRPIRSSGSLTPSSRRKRCQQAQQVFN
ncbi:MULTISPECIES: hypothetical protein [unclassified Sphingopyxis]|uniref:hypothetical protein n=1 Tax=unclassified Sphingopyxis TaxID=2614943 RepID=UPI0006C17E3E|nr:MULTISPECIES: hypothetical protein [unclassified Sphingopyxis]KTE54056.1 hypothetical protein ATE69_11580 [Sphingopyxis sp. H071]KTE60335.1 hypothetical protein ATE66_08990 [Sphingopyxis sp. H107]KTE73283.1 hypothetical protein ATE60_07100 [Sphingopyxis sp. H081]GAO81002.1 hypothetical protein SC1_04328 [Sphingopyxis sp. C-1]KTE25764.1 hypothetical protein ATE61_08475 [Sphingopyxis sp. H057]